MKTKSAGARDYTTGRAARELRVSPNHVRALCQGGIIAARATRGGHWRIPKNEIQRLRQEGVPDPPPTTGVESLAETAIVSATNQPHRHPSLLAEPSKEAIASADEVVRLENEVKATGLKRAKEEHLDWFRERERRQSAEKAARDRQTLELRAQRLRREWENNCVAYGLEGVPDDAPEELRLRVCQYVREAIADLSPSDTQEITESLIGAALDRALRPWRHSKDIEKAVQEARSQLPSMAKNWNNSQPSEWDLRAIRVAREAIAQSGNDATFAEMRSTAIGAGRQIANEYEHQEQCKRIVECIYLPQTPNEQERARQTVMRALEKLPVASGRYDMERVRDEVLAPFKAADESVRARSQATAQADLCLLHVDSYLERIAADRNSKWESGSYLERYQLAQQLKKEIRPMLIQAILEEPLALAETHTFVESLVDRRI